MQSTLKIDENNRVSQDITFNSQEIVVMTINFQLIGQTRQMPTSLFYIPKDVNKERVKQIKELYSKDCLELAEIKKVIRETTKIAKNYSARVKMAEGSYLFAIDKRQVNGNIIYGASFKKVYEKIQVKIKEFFGWVELFIKNYEKIYRQSWIDLGKYFDKEDYISPELVKQNPDLIRSQFQATIRVRSFEQEMSILEKVSPVLAKSQELEKEKEKLDLALENREYIVKTVIKTITDISSSLTNEKRKIIAPTIKNIQNFVDQFVTANIAKDKKLEDLILEVDKIFSGAPEQIAEEFRFEQKQVAAIGQDSSDKLKDLGRLLDFAEEIDRNLNEGIYQDDGRVFG